MVQLLDGAHLVTQGCELSDHVHPLMMLLFFLHGDVLGRVRILAVARVAVDALGCNAQPADVHGFQRLLDLLGRLTRILQALFLLLEKPHVRRLSAADDVPRCGLHQHGVIAVHRFFLETGQDCTGGDSFFGEQVGCSEEHTDAYAALFQRSSHRADHRGRRSIVNAAGKQDVAVRSLVGRQFLQQHIDHAVPQYEAAPWTNVTTSLTTFEHKAPRTILEKHAQQSGRRHVQVGGDAIFLQYLRLIGPAAGDQRKWRAVSADDVQLLLTQTQGDKAQNADPPGAVSHQLLGFFQQSFHCRRAHHGKRQERQRSPFGHPQSEFAPIANPSHWPLHDRIMGSVGLGQGAVLIQRPDALRSPRMVIDGLADRR
ncbi:MAG: hypothetical protein MAG451_02629 [Anaerolineales bacterium]|nr:hypothetical protein [Anaerolineales bacterium]